MIRTAVFDFTAHTVAETGLEAALEALRAGRFVWFDVQTADGDAAGALAPLAAAGLPPRVLEALRGAPEEGRIDLHDDCLHLGFSEAHYEGGRLDIAPLDVVAGGHWLGTAHRTPLHTLDRLWGTYQADFLAFGRSPGFLLYEIADGLHDAFRRGLRALSDEIGALQGGFMERGDEDLFAAVLMRLRDLVAFRRATLAVREILSELALRKSRFVSETTQPHLQAVAAMMDRLAGDLVLEREALSDTLQLHMGLVGHRTNKIVKILTCVSAVFLPLTFLCGVYGMNFEHMPELTATWGYPLFWVLVATLSLLMFLFFRRQKWI